MRESVGGAISLTVILAIWEIIGLMRLFPVYFLPPPSLIAATAYQMIASGELARNLVESLRLYITGYLFGVGTAVPAGLLIGRIKKAELVLGPLVDVFRPLPGLGIYPIAIILFGIGFRSQVAVIWWGTFFAMIINVVEGCRNVDPILIRAGQSLDADRMQTFIHVVLPSVIPYVVAGVRVAAASGLRVLVAAEMLAATTGLGFLILYSSIWLQYARVFVGLGSLTALCFAIDRSINAAVENVLLQYKRIGYRV